MKIDKFHIKTVIVIVALACFNFLFLGTEYLFDNMMAYVTGAKGVVMAESYVLGAGFLGFILFPLLDGRMKKAAKGTALFIGALLGIICIFSIWQHTSYISTLLSGCAVFIVYGIFGGCVHYRASVILKGKDCLARMIGAAYALGILLQFINNNLMTNDAVEVVWLAVILAIFVILLINTENMEDPEEAEPVKPTEIRNPLLAEISMVGTIILMSCIFSALNVSVTYIHAGGSVDIGQWPRLFLAVSGLVAGFLYDVNERRYMNLIMYCVTLLSVISVVVTAFGGPFLIGLLVFYLSAGFFVVFFTTVFMELSYHLKTPKLWAGAGRAVNNLCAVITGSSAMSFLLKGEMFVVIVALVLFVAISVLLFIYSQQFEIRIEKSDVSDEEKFRLFCEKFAISDRERDVLKALLVSDENVQDIAKMLSMSRAVLYRYIASLNDKTNTRSRIGLLQFYYTWKK